MAGILRKADSRPSPNSGYSSEHMALLQSLLDDFQGVNVDTAAWLVEGAGRFLYLVPETTQRMENMLEARFSQELTAAVNMQKYEC